MNTKKFSDFASKNWTLNATAATRKKFDGGVTGQSTTSTPWKFDSVSRRHSTAPGSRISSYRWLKSLRACVCPSVRVFVSVTSTLSRNIGLMQ